jgi:hypothetical protein
MPLLSLDARAIRSSSFLSIIMDDETRERIRTVATTLLFACLYVLEEQQQRSNNSRTMMTTTTTMMMNRQSTPSTFCTHRLSTLYLQQPLMGKKRH